MYAIGNSSAVHEYVFIMLLIHGQRDRLYGENASRCMTLGTTQSASVVLAGRDGAGWTEAIRIAHSVHENVR